MKLNWSTLTGPTVLVNRTRAKRNIESMKAKAEAAQVQLRPHFKTHQSTIIGKWFGTPETTPIAVSSLKMANEFASAGWRDIHIAIPVNPRELPALNNLASKVNLTLSIEHEDTLELLSHLSHKVAVSVEVDTGYGRTGIHWQQYGRIKRLLDALQAHKQVNQLGLMVHSGHSYLAHGLKDIQGVHQESSHRLKELLDMMDWQGEPLRVSIGDTPTCSQMSTFPGATEIRPGNYVFYDLQQKLIGSCDWNDIALAVACPVIARYPEREEVVVHGGAVHFSKDSAEMNGQKVFGQVMHTTENGWGAPVGDAYIKGLSQEHGKIHLPKTMIKDLKLGDMLVIVPAHSCLTMSAMGEFICFDD
ncbi:MULTISPECIES: alanine racemase [Gammaproteobacteria]|uniref:alanine racemase n=1 Tax=Gammaproteobacteria TaxID=1236 RepID=UPI000DCFE6BF|nr:MULTISPECIES: alanine racemase [Gammaproteobacteria]RTE86523.1 alanine racemase [Aliidiomarina sp. B3213]TCZ90922.1 alanine racemase [Lysobacter sp. N42]